MGTCQKLLASLYQHGAGPTWTHDNHTCILHHVLKAFDLEAMHSTHHVLTYCRPCFWIVRHEEEHVMAAHTSFVLTLCVSNQVTALA